MSKPKPCPDLPKGEVCPLCGGSYVCLYLRNGKKTQKKPSAPKKAQP